MSSTWPFPTNQGLVPEGYPTLQSWILVQLGSHYGGSMLKRHFWDNATQWHDPLVQYHEHGNMAHITYTSSCLGRTQQTIHYFQVGSVDPSQITQQKLRMGVGPEHAFIPNWAARCTVKFGDSKLNDGKWWKMTQEGCTMQSVPSLRSSARFCERWQVVGPLPSYQDSTYDTHYSLQLWGGTYYRKELLRQTRQESLKHQQYAINLQYGISKPALVFSELSMA